MGNVFYSYKQFPSNCLLHMHESLYKPVAAERFAVFLFSMRLRRQRHSRQHSRLSANRKVDLFTIRRRNVRFSHSLGSVGLLNKQQRPFQFQSPFQYCSFITNFINVRPSHAVSNGFRLCANLSEARHRPPSHINRSITVLTFGYPSFGHSISIDNVFYKNTILNIVRLSICFPKFLFCLE